MGKKSKKHDKYEQDYVEDKPSLKLVLKVGGVPLTPDVGSDSLDDGMERRVKKKRRLQEKSDSEDESEMSQKWNQQNYDDDDDEDFGKARNQREKKSANDERTPLQCCLDHIQKALQRKDVNGFFAFPVTDSIAPGYSNVITKAMDFSTMKKKIDKGLYKSIAEYKADYQLMMNNCMAYNHPDTIYHKEAKRLLAVGSKHINKEKINQMRRNFAFMSNLTKEEMSLNDEQENTSETSFQVEFVADKLPQTKKDNDVGKFEAVPDDMSPDEILQQVQTAASAASERLQTLAPNSKIGYLKKKTDGTTALSILNPDNSGIISPKERVVDLGGLVGRLSSGSDSISITKEDKRNKVTPVTYLNYGAFTSFAPIFDSSSANLDKEQSDFLLSTYGDETGIQYSKSLQHFVADCGEYATSMVDELLDVLTNGSHSKTDDSMDQQELLEVGQQFQDRSANDNPNQELQTGNSRENKEMADAMLSKASNLILSLHETQHNRLSQEHTSRLDNCKPSDDEINLANQVTDELTQLIRNVTPGDVVGVKELRHAMGVSLDCFDADTKLDDLIRQNNNSHHPPAKAGTTEVIGLQANQHNIPLNQAVIQRNSGFVQIQGNAQLSDIHSSTSMPVNNTNIHLIQPNIQDNTIMLGGSSQMILTGHQFNQNTPQVIVGNSFQSSASYTMINTTCNNTQLLGAGGLQIVQTSGQPAGQAMAPLIQGGNIFLQGDGMQQIIGKNLQGNVSTDLSKMQSGSIVIQQPVYNANISIGQQPQLDQHFIIQ